jgi:hypothetical protein
MERPLPGFVGTTNRFVFWNPAKRKFQATKKNLF